ncbi:3'-5' exonuclease [Brevibacillus porteri]|uniref:3'-5' exonuclease n=1 Tax=Brevibacillus porteri TaxID=2126350 RepID=A0ABX5FTU2_9BACL|nr:3'-5' exonuclease [Brevibacillus porteri]MED1798398.1 exonuclease domain-containing protein [Brevibacillus porteri]MED2129313.1 exonuclease domain-containing protein [Brevibacillus porteri]MED2748562.1 exonuclease domain-containing protein [Brevibacillus porteri]MED2816969.1 exonuclease domain-containing protein [Brevibacillus porteri]MED2896074.1 exonuclease domain-containing protein [Brevibacillus porteri]
MSYIILDLEATCWENDRTKQNEIIEIGAVKLDENLNVVGEFQTFIKPKLNPVLSDFCKSLTSIKQEEVDNAPSFGKAISNFKNWIGNDYYLCSWGFYDKKQFKMDCELHKTPTNWIRNHISIKHQHGKMIGTERGVGMEKALKMLNIPLDGTHHRGIDDARNIAKIFIKIFDKLEF